MLSTLTFHHLFLFHHKNTFLCSQMYTLSLSQGSESPMMLGDSKSDLEDVDP